MIYTVGLRADHDEALDRDFQCIKKGRHYLEDNREYLGSFAFETIEIAADFIADWHLHDFAVYGLLADWNSDTYQVPGENFRRLKNDAGLVRLLH